MSTKTILLPVGTRPEAIKMSPVARALRARGQRAVICATGQHEALTLEALASTGERPDLQLTPAPPGLDLAGMLGFLTASVGRELARERPDAVLVHGDTTSTLAAALAATCCRIPLGHVEAGLRSGDIDAPFPEEIYRRLVDKLASAWFAPTDRCRETLLHEGAEPSRVWVTGNPVVDALRSALESEPQLPFDIERGLEARPNALVTAHRRESHGEALHRICDAVAALAEAGVQIVWPVHPNPEVERTVHERLSGRERITICGPLPYATFVRLLSRVDLVLTDSGGVQEEASCLGKPALVLRDLTERPEVFETGVVALTGTRPERIVPLALEWLRAPPVAARVFPLGDGHAGEIIAEKVEEWLQSPAPVSPPARP